MLVDQFQEDGIVRAIGSKSLRWIIQRGKVSAASRNASERRRFPDQVGPMLTFSLDIGRHKSQSLENTIRGLIFATSFLIRKHAKSVTAEYTRSLETFPTRYQTLAHLLLPWAQFLWFSSLSINFTNTLRTTRHNIIKRICARVAKPVTFLISIEFLVRK